MSAADFWPRSGLSCRVLGPLEVAVDGSPVNVGGAISRRVMGALVAVNGRALSDDRLIEQVWDEPPRAPLEALRVVVWRIRSVLGPAGRDALHRTTGGYALAIPAEATDYGRFTAGVYAGLAGLAAGRYDQAVQDFGAALALWRGEPWSEFEEMGPLTSIRLELNELRDVAIEELQAARLARGELATTVAALHAAVDAAPYRERRWELLALGLYRSGRQVQALTELRRVRALLTTDIGVEPGPRLRAIEQRMLNQDPDLIVRDRLVRSHE
ncbi:BTAD domain-containing putative transcriptional regulator [Nocardia sp. NPDC020380]|uniref:AfsR/SARP family transcriptional regulator n=1 Tax=Nocardia sp. NPDC020380 TaxID=3364309 RepID=UPI0037B462D6